MFEFEELYLCIKGIFVDFSLVLWLVLGFGWKFQVKKRQTCHSVEIAGEYQH